MSTSWRDVLNTLQRHDLSFSDVDTIEVSQETYDDWQERMSTTSSVSNHETIEGPAVRVTQKQERIVYVNEYGEREVYKIE